MAFRARILALLLFSAFAAGSASAASDTATYVYDGHGRLYTVTYANGTVITYNYDSAGNRQTVVTSCSGSGC